MVLMLIRLAALLLPSFLLLDALTNISQTYYPPCQLGQLPSSRISYGYPGPRAQNLQQTGACTDPIRLQNSTPLCKSKRAPKINPQSPVESSPRKPPSPPYSSFTDFPLIYFPTYPFINLSYPFVVNAPYPLYLLFYPIFNVLSLPEYVSLI
jgi:hypothetical protein